MTIFLAQKSGLNDFEVKCSKEQNDLGSKVCVSRAFCQSLLFYFYPAGGHTLRVLKAAQLEILQCCNFFFDRSLGYNERGAIDSEL